MSPYQIKNGALICSVLVLREDTSVKSGPSRKKDDWLLYAIDLRVVNTMKQAGFEGEEVNRTCLYHNGDLIAIVDVPMHELLPHWLKTLHKFETSHLATGLSHPQDRDEMFG